MLTAYERHLLAGYLANAASSLHHRNEEASALATWVAEARDTGAFLVFDEADSLLADRRFARRNWEVS